MDDDISYHAEAKWHTYASVAWPGIDYNDGMAPLQWNFLRSIQIFIRENSREIDACNGGYFVLLSMRYGNFVNFPSQSNICPILFAYSFRWELHGSGVL